MLGVVNNPMTGHLYSAVRGKGAYVNGDKKLATSGVEHLKDAMVLMEFSVGANEDKKKSNIDNATMLLSKAHSIRCPGPAALDISWVGAGSADCFFHAGIHCWDMAAGAVIVREAGGAVLSPDGGEFDLMGRGIVAAASRQLAQELAENIKVYTKCGRDMAEKYCAL